jgi:hypothetical protein
VDLSDPNLLPGLSEDQKLNLLTKPWQGYQDFNPNRIVTATWEANPSRWTINNSSYSDTLDFLNTSLVLPKELTLTAGQTYYWAVEALTIDGKRNISFGQFKTQTAPPAVSAPFSNVTVLTHGASFFTGNGGVPTSFYKMAESIAQTGNDGLILRYDKPTGLWVPVDGQGKVLTELTGNLEPKDAGYEATLISNIKSKYVNSNLAPVSIRSCQRHEKL